MPKLPAAIQGNFWINQVGADKTALIHDILPMILEIPPLPDDFGAKQRDPSVRRRVDAPPAFDLANLHHAGIGFALQREIEAARPVAPIVPRPEGVVDPRVPKDRLRRSFLSND